MHTWSRGPMTYPRSIDSRIPGSAPAASRTNVTPASSVALKFCAASRHHCVLGDDSFLDRDVLWIAEASVDREHRRVPEHERGAAHTVTASATGVSGGA